jgi:uncharacterized membrane protein
MHMPALAAGSSGGGSLAVVRLQVGLLGAARSMQEDLERIAERADTSSSEGLAHVLQETAVALLRHPELCVYGASDCRGCRGPAAAEQAFNELCLEERSKFEKETLVNVNAWRNAAKPAPAVATTVGPGGVGLPERNEYVVVTVLAAVEDSELPQVRSLEDLQTALKKLGSCGASAVSAVEVMWAPQEEGDTLMAQELAEKFPTLVPL